MTNDTPDSLAEPFLFLSSNNLLWLLRDELAFDEPMCTAAAEWAKETTEAPDGLGAMAFCSGWEAAIEWARSVGFQLPLAPDRIPNSGLTERGAARGMLWLRDQIETVEEGGEQPD